MLHSAESGIKSRRPSISVNPRCLDTRILSLGQRGNHLRMAEGMHMRACVVQHSKFCARNVVMGQKQTSVNMMSMSALPPKADIATQI